MPSCFVKLSFKFKKTRSSPLFSFLPSICATSIGARGWRSWQIFRLQYSMPFDSGSLRSLLSGCWR